MSTTIVLRIGVESPDVATARCLESALKLRIDSIGRFQKSETKPYWKVSGWFEVFICLESDAGSELAFDQLLSSLGTGWQRFGYAEDEEFAIWNPSQNRSFFDPSVRWACVERFREADEFPP
jgi:hypothetical protein